MHCAEHRKLVLRGRSLRSLPQPFHGPCMFRTCYIARMCYVQKWCYMIVVEITRKMMIGRFDRTVDINQD